jgi:hypothetical protein
MVLREDDQALAVVIITDVLIDDDKETKWW